MCDFDYETIEYRGYKIVIRQDAEPVNPREEFDNLGVMLCWHKNYCLGDFECQDAPWWAKQPDYFQEWCSDNWKNIAVILPLFLYDHSGIGMSTDNSSYPYNCPWDSGRVGVIFVLKEALRKEYNVQRVSRKVIERAEEILRQEVELYHQYISGQVYWYEVLDGDGETVDSCSGFYGSEWKKNGLLEYAKGWIDAEVEKLVKDRRYAIMKHGERVKRWIKGRVPLIYRTPAPVMGG